MVNLEPRAVSWIGRVKARLVSLKKPIMRFGAFLVLAEWDTSVKAKRVLVECFGGDCPTQSARFEISNLKSKNKVSPSKKSLKAKSSGSEKKIDGGIPTPLGSTDAAYPHHGGCHGYNSQQRQRYVGESPARR